MIKKMSELADVLPELLLGIFAYGAVCEIIGVLLVSDKLLYSVGLIIGILMASAMAVHMAWSLSVALSFAQEDAVKMMQKHNLLRYGAVTVLLGLLMVSGLGNPLAAFLGIMGLKVAAYLQPFTHKLFRR